MGALSAKIESAARTNEMSQTIAKTVPALERAMKDMDKMGVSQSILSFYFFGQINEQMMKFDKVCEDMEVRVDGIDSALEGVY